MAAPPPITYAESARQIDRLLSAAQEATATGPADVAIERWRAVLDHPCAHHQVLTYEILDDIFQLLRNAGRYDEAIDAKREAIAAGYRSSPDPEADIAECLVAAGQRDEGDRLCAELRERDPEDPWLNNSAGFAYAGVDDREALRWLLDGIDLAIASGDHDQIVGQLLEMAERSAEALGESVDPAVVERVSAFRDGWTRPKAGVRFGDFERPAEHRCEHCGWDPAVLRPSVAGSGRGLSMSPSSFDDGLGGFGGFDDGLGRLAGLDGGGVGGGAPRGTGGGKPSYEVAVAWFPADEWSAAIERWPDLLDGRPEEHLAYSHAIEAHTKRLAIEMTGRPIAIGVLTVDGLVAFAAEQGDDPGTGGARSAYAAEQLRLGNATPWPPGRNDPCWCGSGHKYKPCCGPIPAVPLD